MPLAGLVVADVIVAFDVAGIAGTLTPISLLTYVIDPTWRSPQKHHPNGVKGTGRPITCRGSRGRGTATLPQIGPGPDVRVALRRDHGQ
jgi:hypothetical protein